jgi:hypothetical protein
VNYFMVKFGAVIAGGGIAWATYRATDHLNLGSGNPLMQAMNAILAQTGPLEVCAAGIVLWLLGKWRMHTVVH